jgi:hypothetical protein
VALRKLGEVKKMRTLLVSTALFFGSVAAVIAQPIPTSLNDPICQQAVSLAACQAHVVYVNGLHPYVDVSPIYMKQIDPRDNPTLNYAGGAASSGGSASGGSASSGK